MSFIQPNLSPLEIARQTELTFLRRITQVALMLRMTPEERAAIREARKTDVEVEDIMSIMEQADYVDLDDQVTQYSLYKLEQKGHLGEGRMATILSTEVQDRERPEIDRRR